MSIFNNTFKIICCRNRGIEHLTYYVCILSKPTEMLMLLFVLFVLGTVGYGPKMNFSHRIKSEFYSEDNLFYDGTKMLKEPWSFIFWKQSIISDLSYLTICDTKYWEVLVTFLCLFLALLSPNSETRKGQDFVTHKKDILGKKGNKCFFFNYCISFIFFNFAKSLKLQNPLFGP